MKEKEIPSTYQGLPVLTAEEMRKLDRSVTEKLGIPALDLMERAGGAVAGEALAFLKQRRPEAAASSLSIVVCCGRGANGGDGLVAARYLARQGIRVSAYICPSKKDQPYPELVRVNLDRAKESGVVVFEAGPESGLAAALAGADVVLDALLGTGSSGKPAGAVHHMIQEMTRSKKPVLAIDIPSGIHPDTGYHSGVFVTAEMTLTLGFPKRGLLAKHAQRNVGTLKVLDIGYPKVK